MRALIWTVAAALALTACAGGPSGDQRGRDRSPVRALLSTDALMFASFDANGDVVISQDEIEAGITREFARADTSRDGQLSAIEYGAWSNLVLGGEQTPPYRFDFDRNVDNTITLEEFTNEIRSRANDYDENDDNLLQRTEFVRLMNQTRPAAERMQRRLTAPAPR